MKAQSYANCITIVSLLILSIFICSANALPEQPKQLPFPQAPPINANSYLLMDHYSGQILAKHNASASIEPASLTKMMTIYVADQEMRQGNVKFDDLVIISPKAAGAPGARMFLEANSEVKVIDLFRGIIIQSGNDAATALAEHIAGSTEIFATMMNNYAKELGMKNTNFTNPTGLSDKDHYTTAEDLALLSKALINDFPDTYRIYAEKEFKYNGISQNNRNRLLWRNNLVDGIKTGQTDNAGFCLAASAQKGDMRLTAIVMGTKSDELRNAEANKLLIWGFRFFETYKIYEAKTELKKIKVWSGIEKEVAVGLNKDIYITLPPSQYRRLNATMEIAKDLEAPFVSNIQVGNYSVKLQDVTLIEEPIVTLSGVRLGNLWQRMRDNVVLQAKKLERKVSG